MKLFSLGRTTRTDELAPLDRESCFEKQGKREREFWKSHQIHAACFRVKTVVVDCSYRRLYLQKDKCHI